MRTAIIFSSMNVFAEQYPGLIAEKLAGQTEMFNIAFESNIELSRFSHVIIGCCLAGRPRTEITEFCRKNKDALLRCKLGLYIDCMNKEADPDMFDALFTPELSERAAVKERFGEKKKKSGLAERSIQWMEGHMMAQGDEGRSYGGGKGIEDRIADFARKISRA